MTAAVGIISYLPENLHIRDKRGEILNKLIQKCNQLFNIPIIVIAQNGGNLSLNYKNLIIKKYNKLGIVGARKELRKVFLASQYDYLIMLDDDCTLFGLSGQEYLKQINDNPDCFIEFNKTLLKLFAISRTIFSQVDFEDIQPEKSEGFEDRIFVNKLRKMFPNRRRIFVNTGLSQYSISSEDSISTGYTDQNLGSMLQKTEEIIKKL